MGNPNCIYIFNFIYIGRARSSSKTQEKVGLTKASYNLKLIANVAQCTLFMFIKTDTKETLVASPIYTSLAHIVYFPIY